MENMSVGERDRRTNVIASDAASEFCRAIDPSNKEDIAKRPDWYLAHSVPYLTVRTLQRNEESLKSLKCDSKWIKWFAIITGVLSAVLVLQNIVLAYYARKLDEIMTRLAAH